MDQTFSLIDVKMALGRAASHANAAVNTCRKINHNLAARACIGRALKKRISAGGRLFAPSVLKIVYVILATGIVYLSAQLIQGSMVKTRIGTSANWHPPNILSSGGRLAKVGVLTLKRFKNLVPSPLT
jgi:hypothetical protein